MIKKLTKAQTDKFPAYANKWTAIGLCTARANRQLAEQHCRDAYVAGGLPPPKLIIWAESPQGLLLTAHVLKRLAEKEYLSGASLDSVESSVRSSVMSSVMSSVGSSVQSSVHSSVQGSVQGSVRSSVGSSVWGSVMSSVENSVQSSVQGSVQGSVRSSVGSSVWGSVMSSVENSVQSSVQGSVQGSVHSSVENSVLSSVMGSVENSVWSSVMSSVWSSVMSSVMSSVHSSVHSSVQGSVRSSVHSSVRSSVHSSVQGSVLKNEFNALGSYGQHDAPWLSFYDYFRNECDLYSITEKLLPLTELAKQTGWNIFYQDIAILSEKPIELHLVDNQLHSLDGPAIRWADGYELYFVKGQEKSSLMEVVLEHGMR